MATTDDYIPHPENLFNDFQANYVTQVTANLGPWGIPVADPDYTAMLAEQAVWGPAFAAGIKSANPTHSQTVAKQTAQHDYVKLIRIFNKRHIAFNPAITNANRASLNLPIPDGVRTEDPTPTYAPQGSVHRIIHEIHKLRIVDPTHPTTKEMPFRWHVQVWTSITPPVAPATEPPTASFYFAGNTNKFKFDAHWPSNFGQTAYYYVLYENTHGETGPKSPVFSAVIA